MAPQHDTHKMTIGFGYAPRAAFASHPQQSRGRAIAEPPSLTRSAFQRDRDRLIHSNAFRRLKHKTQVFIAYDGDHYRTRLTHTIEVSQIARALARALRLDEELAEAIALAHDFGHTPFGHAGEEALDRVMAPFGGFDHNAHSLRLVTKLEHRYGAFDGLNLTWETLEGLVKHNGPLMGPLSASRPLPHPIAEFNAIFDLSLDQFAGPEAQCAAIADDIAYNAHDIDDGLRCGLLDREALHTIPLTQPLIDIINARYHELDLTRFAYELVRQQITLMVEDVIGESLARLDALAPSRVEDIYGASKPVIAFSEKMCTQEKELKNFLFENLYFHPEIMARRSQGEAVITRLFEAYMNDLHLLPPDWLKDAKIDERQEEARARLIGDFLAGMTDHYALRTYQQLFGNMPDLF